MIAEYPPIHATQRFIDKSAETPTTDHPNYYQINLIVTGVVKGPKIWMFDHSNLIKDHYTFCEWMRKINAEHRHMVGEQMLHLYNQVDPSYGQFYAMTQYPNRPNIMITDWNAFDNHLHMCRGSRRHIEHGLEGLLDIIDPVYFVVARRSTKLRRIKEAIEGPDIHSEESLSEEL